MQSGFHCPAPSQGRERIGSALYLSNSMARPFMLRTAGDVNENAFIRPQQASLCLARFQEVLFGPGEELMAYFCGLRLARAERIAAEGCRSPAGMEGNAAPGLHAVTSPGRAAGSAGFSGSAFPNSR